MTDGAVPTSEVTEYLDHLRNERDVSPNTVLAYGRDLEELVTFFSTYYGGEAWSWQGVNIPSDRVYFALTIVSLTLVITALYRWTRFGLDTRAVVGVQGVEEQGVVDRDVRADAPQLADARVPPQPATNPLSA